MRLKQFIALFICTLVVVIFGSTTLALLPVYMQQLGADESSTGIYFSLAFAALTLGSIVSGWLSDRFQRRRLIIIVAAILAMPATFMMGQVNGIALLTVLTMIVYFLGNLVSTAATILTGMYADPKARGLIFGGIATAAGLARIISGFTSGAIVDRWGFSKLFMLLALVPVVLVVAGLMLDDKRLAFSPTESSEPSTTHLNSAIWLIIAAFFLVFVTNFSGGLGQPLAMNALGFDAAAIASPLAISGLVSLSLPFLGGWLSDRVGRRPLLILIYLAVSLGALTLSLANELWQFWLAAALFTIVQSARSVGMAYVTDVSSPQGLGSAISRLAAVSPLAGIVGYGATGAAIQALGVPTTYLIAAVLPLCAIILLLVIRQHPDHQVTETTPLHAMGQK